MRIALGSVAPTVLRSRKTEALLRGKSHRRNDSAAASDELGGRSSPSTTLRSTARYRRRVAQKLLEEFFEAHHAAGRQTGMSTPVISQPARPDRGRRAVTSGVDRAALFTSDGVIAAIGGFEEFRAAVPSTILARPWSCPDWWTRTFTSTSPGRTDWEGFSTATRAAAAGGVTTLIEMPLNSIPATTTAEAFREKVAAAAGKLAVDVGFWGGVVPGNTAELAPLWDAGVFGFKCFLVPCGWTEFAPLAKPICGKRCRCCRRSARRCWSTRAAGADREAAEQSCRKRIRGDMRPGSARGRARQRTRPSRCSSA